MRLPIYLSLLGHAETTLAEAYLDVAEAHGHEPDIHFLCLTFARQCVDHAQQLVPIVHRLGAAPVDDEPERLHARGLGDTRSGPLGMLRDLHDVYVLAGFVDMTWTIVGQSAHAVRDSELIGVVDACEKQTAAQLVWLQTRMKQSAPQVLVGP
ncbi:hypothetical protein ACI3KY_15990 [Microbacterium sp. ZW T2_14]|uniref:hypothetical protein n=1 Tax=Microbacterium sp. ZW T2_14 TaxID=3378079 RepID=UPI0038520DA4